MAERTMIAIDTDALSYAHPVANRQELNTPEKIEIAAKVRYFLSAARDRNCIVVMPIFVLSEYLVCYNESEYDSIYSEMDGNYQLEEFGYKAAMQLATLRKDVEALKDTKAKTGQTKDQVKFDQIIASIALASGATEILTGNGKDYLRLTANKLTPKDISTLPKPHIQPPLPKADGTPV